MEEKVGDGQPRRGGRLKKALAALPYVSFQTGSESVEWPSSPAEKDGAF